MFLGCRCGSGQCPLQDGGLPPKGSRVWGKCPWEVRLCRNQVPRGPGAAPGAHGPSAETTVLRGELGTRDPWPVSPGGASRCCQELACSAPGQGGGASVSLPPGAAAGRSQDTWTPGRRQVCPLGPKAPPPVTAWPSLCAMPGPVAALACGCGVWLDYADLHQSLEGRSCPGPPRAPEAGPPPLPEGCWAQDLGARAVHHGPESESPSEPGVRLGPPGPAGQRSLICQWETTWGQQGGAQLACPHGAQARPPSRGMTLSRCVRGGFRVGRSSCTPWTAAHTRTHAEPLRPRALGLDGVVACALEDVLRAGRDMRTRRQLTSHLCSGVACWPSRPGELSRPSSRSSATLPPAAPLHHGHLFWQRSWWLLALPVRTPPLPLLTPVADRSGQAEPLDTAVRSSSVPTPAGVVAWPCWPSSPGHHVTKLQGPNGLQRTRLPQWHGPGTGPSVETTGGHG